MTTDYQKRIVDCCIDTRISATAFRLYSLYASEKGIIDGFRFILFGEKFKLTDDEVGDALENLEECGYITQVPMGDDTYYQLH